jgi:hypothetical protein
MMISRMLAFMLCTVFSGSLLAQAALDGLWKFSMSSPFGQVSADVVLKTEGSLLTGEFDLGGGRKWPIEQGGVSGNTINFRITRDGANVTYIMNADVNGNHAVGTASAMGSTSNWSMSRAE